MQKRLTIGMPCYDDFDGVFFTIQSLRLYHGEALGCVQILVVDGNPSSPHGRATGHFCANAGQLVKYIPAPQAHGTAQTKELVFRHAETEFVLCMDCHVLLESGSLGQLISFLEKDEGNLLQGPLVYDDGVSISTHFDPIWRGGMEGIWATDERGKNPNAPAFEIPAQGMGVFACRKDAWPSFHPLMRGFGGEEVYMHRKFRSLGKKTLCLPFLRWHHRFGRPEGQPYPNLLEDRIFNYAVGHLELGMELQPIYDHFKTQLEPSKVLRTLEFASQAFWEWQDQNVVMEKISDTMGNQSV